MILIKQHITSLFLTSAAVFLLSRSVNAQLLATATLDQSGTTVGAIH